MFRTFWTQYSDTRDFDRFLNQIVSEGYTPVFIREFYKPVFFGYHWRLVAEVYVTARQAPEVAA